jgi:hypothetical protein
MPAAWLVRPRSTGGVSLDEASQFHTDEGVEVGMQARQLYLEGVAVE